MSLGPSLVLQTVKNPPAMQETLVQSLGWEDPLEKGMATHSSVLAWRIPWSLEESDMTEQLMRQQDHSTRERIPEPRAIEFTLGNIPLKLSSGISGGFLNPRIRGSQRG